jgi:hypothetical protein
LSGAPPGLTSWVVATILSQGTDNLAQGEETLVDLNSFPKHVGISSKIS